MKFNFFINEIMTKKSGILTAVAVATAISTAPASAETNNQITKQKIEQITCSTRLACEKLSLSIQAQIDKLEKSDNPDYDKLDELQKQLIATKDSTIVVENNKQAKQVETIAQENEKQKAYSEVSDKLASIEGSLLSN